MEHWFITKSALEVTAEERERVFDQLWDHGGFAFPLANYQDLLFNEAANDLVSDYLRRKIRLAVKDPAVAEKLVPKGYPYATKRPQVTSRNRGHRTSSSNPMTLLLRSSDLATEYCVVDPQHDDRADNGDDHAVEIEAGNSDPAQGVENEAPDNGPDNAEHAIEKKALTRLVDDFAGNEARDQPQDNPPDDRHHTPYGDMSGLTEKYTIGFEFGC